MANPKKVIARFLLEAMSNLPPKDTGVEGVVIWVSVGEFSGAALQHGPRVKVMLGEKITSEGLENAASVTLTDPPKVVGTLPGKVRKMVVRFIARNRAVLLDYWDGRLSSREMLDLIQKV